MTVIGEIRLFRGAGLGAGSTDAHAPDGAVGAVARAVPTPFGSSRLRWSLVASDATAITMAWVAACLAGLNHSGNPRQLFGFGVVLVAATLCFFVTHKLYRSSMCSVRSVENAAILRACVCGGVVTWLVAGRLMVFDISAQAVVTSQLLSIALVWAGRAVYRSSLKRSRAMGRHARPVVLIGGGEEVYELHKMLSSDPELGYEVVGAVGRESELAEWAGGLPYLGSSNDAVDVMRASGATGAIVAGSGLPFRELNQVVRSLLAAGMHVQLFGGLLGIAPGRLQMMPIAGQAAFYLEQVQLTGLQARLKRLLDVVLGSVGLLVLAPVIAVLALATRVADGGTSFFRQPRVGRDGHPFTIYKIRTMVMDAEARQPQLHHVNERSGPLFKMHDDPRFTRLGRLLDVTSLNELPQLWNVVKGDMSLVGPRPALAREMAAFNDRLLQRNLVRPGITGLWQVEGRDAASFATYERCDLFYVENWSTRLDLMILAQTAVQVVARAGRVLR